LLCIGKRGKGGGFVRATLKSIGAGTIFDKTFSSDDIVELADVEKEIVQVS
jgi:translation elongation factor P/translation initiation factor 5A